MHLLMETRKVIAIYVIYNPEIDVLKKSLDIVKKYVDKIWITDNSKKQHPISDEKIVYSHQPDNKGIAYAQNIGIKYAIENDFDWIVFFDQDSVFDDVFLPNMFTAFETLLKYDVNTYGIGPMAMNRDSGSILNKKSVLKSIEFDGKQYVEVRELMCSASIIRSQMFKEIGLMDEKLFIDGVDFEISWRAANKINARFYIVKECVLQHQLGEGDRKFMGRNTHIPTPFRVYYQVRNSIVLSKRKYVPVAWKRDELTKSLIKLFVIPILLQPRIKYFKEILRGFKDGIILK